MAERKVGEGPAPPNQPKLMTDVNQMSFTSISSSESGLDVTNTSQDTVDTGPLRIERMSLLGPDYIDQRKASVENLLAGRTPDQATDDTPVAVSGSSSSGEGQSLQNFNSCDLSSVIPTYSLLETGLSYSGKLSDCNISAAKDLPLGENVSTDDKEVHTMYHLPVKRTRPASDSLRYRSPLYEEPEIDFADETNGIARQDTAAGDFIQNTPPCQKTPDNRQSTISDQIDSGLYRPEKKYLADEDETVKTPSDDGDAAEALEEVHDPKQGGSVCTPPKQTRIPSNVESSSNASVGYCGSFCCTTFWALFKGKYLCTRFSIFDIFLTLGSIALYIFDVSTDLILSLTYYRKKEEQQYSRTYFGLTLGFVIIPSLIVQVFSFVWVVHDFHLKKRQLRRVAPDKSRWTGADCLTLFLQFVLHFFQLAVLFRYLRAFFYGWKSRRFEVTKDENKRKHFDQLWKYEMFDVNTLRLLESFLESAPQLILQVYIMLMTKQVLFVTVVSCVASLVALSSMMVSIQRATRNSNPTKKQLSVPASAFMFCWRACTISSRVVAFALFLTIQPLAFLIFVLLHWMVSTVWIAVRKTHFCGSKKCAEYLFDAVCGLIYIFCFLNVHTPAKNERVHMRCRMLVFYTVVMGENSVLSILWYFFRPGGDTRVPTWEEINAGSMWNSAGGGGTAKVLSTPDLITKSQTEIPLGYALGILVAVHGFFILGMLFMMVYYILLHPSRSAITCCCLVQTPPEKEPLALVSAPLNGSSEKNTPHPSKPITPGESPKAVVHMSSPPTANPTSGQKGSALDLALRQFSDDDVWHGDTGPSNATTSILRQRRAVQSSPTEEKSSSMPTLDNREDNERSWSKLLFDRGDRAARLYTKQYSQEKLLEESEGLIPDVKEGTSYEARRTDRFMMTVTPTHEKPHIPPDERDTETMPVRRGRHSYRMSGTHPPFRPSILIRPGSQQSGTVSAPRSATHQGPLSTALAAPFSPRTLHSSSSANTSPAKKPLGQSKCHKPLPKKVQTRDYSASMSCLMGGRPMNYAQRRGQALCQNVPRTPSFTITKNEILESIESSV